jgi:hypothetical protein
MLPPGHIAGGYLATYTLLQLTHASFTPEQTQILLLLGALFGFAPDLDYFIFFAQVKKFTIPGNKTNHRKFFSHAPLAWLAIGLSIFFLGQTDFIKYIGLIIWLGSWSHFILDSIEDGVMWLWPFSSKLYAVRDRSVDEGINDTRFWRFWWKFFTYYTSHTTFYLEIIIILIFIFSFSRNYYG